MGNFCFLQVPRFVAGNFYRFLKWRLFAWSFSRWGFSNQTLSIYHKDIHPNQSTLHLRLFTVWNKSLFHYSQWNNETLVLAMGESSQGCSPVDGNRLVIWQPIKKNWHANFTQIDHPVKIVVFPRPLCLVSQKGVFLGLTLVSWRHLWIFPYPFTWIKIKILFLFTIISEKAR